jgi:hypothetical protein
MAFLLDSLNPIAQWFKHLFKCYISCQFFLYLAFKELTLFQVSPLINVKWLELNTVLEVGILVLDLLKLLFEHRDDMLHYFKLHFHVVLALDFQLFQFCLKLHHVQAQLHLQVFKERIL